MATFEGKWATTKLENQDAYLAALGLNWFIRKMAGLVTPYAEIKKEGDKFEMTLTAGRMTEKMEFTVGTDTVHQLPRRTATLSTSWQEGSLVQVFVPLDPPASAGPKTFTYTWSMDGDQILLTMECDEVVSKRWYSKT